MFPKESRKNIIDDYTRSATLEMHLVKSNPAGADDDVTQAALLAIEADYPGYAAQAVPDPGAATIDGSNQGTATTSTMTFQPSGMVTPQTIYGYWWDFVPRLGGSRQMFLFERLTTPIVLASDASQFQRIITVDDLSYNP